MVFDYNSVLMAAGASGVALCFTLATSWLRQRSSWFLLTWAICIAFIIGAIVGFAVFHTTRESLYAIIAGTMLTTAYAIGYGGLNQFRDGRFAPHKVLLVALLGALPVVVPGILGFDGLSFAGINAACAVLLAFTGHRFWSIRAESPLPIGTIAFLQFMLSVSYVLCAIVIFIETPLYLNGEVPDNWAEVVNLVCSVIAITGIGGLFITVHQERISRRHQAASLIDPLTGLHNRRALFERFASGAVSLGAGLIVFDLDDFKGHNDRFGHAFGDKVLRDFAKVLAEHTRGNDMAVRLGGEEFLLVLPESSPAHALALAERIRAVMGRMTYRMGEEAVVCTVSAGVAVANKSDTNLDTLIRKADNALYLSKRSGRNRVSHNTSTAA